MLDKGEAPERGAAVALAAAAREEAHRGARAQTIPSVTYIHGRHDRVKARLRMLKRLPTNHDGEGAAAPNARSIDAAIAFVDQISSGPNFNATLDDDGSAVIEFENRATGFFADITFRNPGHVELYRRLRASK